MSNGIRDPYRYFRIEARELLEGLQHGVAELDHIDDGVESISPLLRLAHTLKGAARVVRLPAISDLAHRVEDVLTPCREASAPPSPDQREELRRLVDDIAARLAGIDRPPSSDEPRSAAPLAPAGVTPSLFETIRLQVVEVDSVLSSVTDTSAELAALRADFRSFEGASQQARLLLSLAARGRTRDVGRETSQRLHEETGDLVTGLDSMRQRLASRVDRIDRGLQRLHEETSRLRLIPTDALWTFLERTTRDAAQTLGKRVRLEIDSRTPRIDTPVFAALQEALLHLVRNAVAHGIETEAARRAAGKPPEGRISVRVSYRGGRLHVACEDDGRGIDIEAVHRAAIAKGWLSDGSAATPNMEETIRLLLRGGVTTTESATAISGRGVGLDVVRTATARMRGELTIRSTPGRGTAVMLDLPVALSAMNALMVEAGDMRVLLPLEGVQRVVRLGAADIRRSGPSEELHLEGEAIPFALLRRLVPTAASAPPRRRQVITVVVVRDETGPAAIGVDRLCGTSEVVVRPLPALADATALVSGASFDSRGVPRLVLDTRAVAEAIRKMDAEASPGAVQPPTVLVVDDSLTTRMLEQSILESAGYAVDLAKSGEDALRRLREQRPALMLVDVEMPGMDGFGLIECLRRNPAWHGIPAILVTSRESQEDRQRGLAVGAQDYVIKGEFDQRRLLRRIRELLP